MLYSYRIPNKEKISIQNPSSAIAQKIFVDLKEYINYSIRDINKNNNNSIKYKYSKNRKNKNSYLIIDCDLSNLSTSDRIAFQIMVNTEINQYRIY